MFCDVGGFAITINRQRYDTVEQILWISWGQDIKMMVIRRAYVVIQRGQVELSIRIEQAPFSSPGAGVKYRMRHRLLIVNVMTIRVRSQCLLGTST